MVLATISHARYYLIFFLRPTPTVVSFDHVTGLFSPSWDL
jgi:hypothetical protein